MFPVELVRPMVKFGKLLDDPTTILADLKTALRSLTSGRPGPAWLDIPLDIQATQVADRQISFESEAETRPDLRMLQEMLSVSKRPVIIAGHGVRLSNSVEKLRGIVTKLQIPLLTTINGMDLIEDSFGLFYGRPNYWGQREANFIIQNSDLVISVGAGLHLETTGFDSDLFAREAKIVVGVYVRVVW